MPQEDPYQDYLKKLDAQLATQAESQDDAYFRTLTNQADGQSPNRSARILKIALKLGGVDVDLIDQNFDEAQQIAADPLFDRKTNPAITRWYAKSPHHVAIAREDLQAGNLQELEKTFYRIDDPLRPFTEKEILKSAERGSTSRAKSYMADKLKADENPTYDPTTGGRADYCPFQTEEEARAAFFKEEIEQRRFEESIIAKGGKMGAMESIKARFRENPAFFVPFASGAVDAASAVNVYKSAKAVEAGIATEDEADYLLRFARMQAAMERRGTDLTAKVTGILSELPAFAGEFAITSGVYSGVKNVVLKGTQEAAGSFIKRMAIKTLRSNLTAATAGAAVQSLAASPLRTVAGAAKRMTPTGELKVIDGELHYEVDPGSGERVWRAIPKALLESFAEVASERTGKLLEVVDAPLIRAISSKYPGKTGLLAREILKKTGTHGPIGEFTEERIGALMKAVGESAIDQKVKGEKFAEIIPSGDQAAAELLAFAALPAGSAALSRIGSKRAQAKAESFKAIGELIKGGKLNELSPDEMENLLGEMSKSMPYSYVPFDAWVDRWQGIAIDPKAAALEAGATEETYEEARRTKVDIQFPTAKFVRAVLPFEEGQYFAENMRTDPLDATATEAKEFDKTQEGEAPVAAAPAAPAVPLPETEEADIENEVKKAVQAVKAEQGDKALYSDPKVKAAQDAADAAAELQLREKLRDQRQVKRTKFYKERRKATRAEVEKEVNARREFKALAFLKDGKQPDGSDLPVGVTPIKLLTSSIPLDQRGTLPPGVTSENGLPPDAVAEMLGYTSGDELLRELEGLMSARSEEAAEAKAKIDSLEVRKKAFEKDLDSLKTEEKATKRETGLGRGGLKTQIERQLRRENRASIADVKEMLKGIKERGGIKPNVPTERIPKGYEHKPGDLKRQLDPTKPHGVLADELSQELADRGLIKDADVDLLYDWVERAVSAVEAAKQAESEIESEAFKEAPKRIREAQKALVENANKQEDVQDAIQEINEQIQKLRGQFGRDRRAATIEGETDTIMAATHGDMVSDGTIGEEAFRAIHSDQQAEAHRAALEHMKSKEYASLKKMVRGVVGNVPTVAGVRADAEAFIRGRKAREITPSMYRRQEATAAREELDAILAGNWQAAFDARLNRLVNHERLRAATEAVDEIGRIVDYMRKFGKDSVRSKFGFAGEQYLAQIDALAERFEFRPVSQKKLEKRESLARWIKEQERNGVDPIISEKLRDEAFRVNYKDASYEELIEIRDGAKNIEHLSETKNSLLASKEKRKADETNRKIVSSTREAFKGVKPKVEPTGEKTAREKVGDKIAQGVAGLRKFSSFTQEADGGKNGFLTETLTFSLNRAQEEELDKMLQAGEKIGKIHSVYTASEKRKMHRREYIPEINDSLSRWDLIGIGLHVLGNEENRLSVKEGYGWSDEQLNAVVKHLDARDLEVINQTWKFLHTEYWPAVRQLGLDVDGIPPEEVKGTPSTVVSRDGKTVEMTGGYYPLKYKDDPAHPHMSIEDLVDASKRGSAFRATTAHAHRKERIGSGGRKPRFDAALLHEHVRDVIHDITHYRWMLDANKILRNPEVAQALQETIGKASYNEMLDTVNAVAANNRQTVDGLNKAAEWLSHKARAAILAGNIATSMKQYLGLTVTNDLLGPIWTARGLKAAGFGLEGIENTEGWIFGNSLFMKTRRASQSREQMEVFAKLQTPGLTGRVGDTLEKIEQIGFSPIIALQWHVDKVTWLGAYQKYAQELGLGNVVSAEERQALEEKIFQMADQAVRDTQGSGLLADMPKVMRTRGVMRAFTLFKTFAVNTLNRFISRTADFKRNPSPKTAMRLGLAFVNYYVVPVVAWSMFRNLLSGGDDDEEIGDRAKRHGVDIAREFFGSIPVFGELGIAGLQAIDDKPFDYRGPAGLGLIGGVEDFATQAGQGEMDDAFWRSALRLTGYATGLPGATQIDKTLRGYQEWQEGDAGIGALLVGPPIKR